MIVTAGFAILDTMQYIKPDVRLFLAFVLTAFLNFILVKTSMLAHFTVSPNGIMFALSLSRALPCIVSACRQILLESP
ncbi:hypothetical protein P6709_20150, partial [Jeotgalibacillus sp. ET6]|nr:hypothetical protein [Jeotgalibacillus sp. ET6]